MKMKHIHSVYREHNASNSYFEFKLGVILARGER